MKKPPLMWNVSSLRSPDPRRDQLGLFTGDVVVIDIHPRGESIELEGAKPNIMSAAESSGRDLPCDKGFVPVAILAQTKPFAVYNLLTDPHDSECGFT
jgi:bifunctional DNA-binding transcriptional regulator/antitoxin component of YhaV-PrlF toxin-antitoxin module